MNVYQYLLVPVLHSNIFSTISFCIIEWIIPVIKRKNIWIRSLDVYCKLQTLVSSGVISDKCYLITWTFPYINPQNIVSLSNRF